MKIIFLTRSLHYGGAERQLVALAKELHRCGHSVIVAALYPDGPLQADLDCAGVPVHIFEKKGRWDVFAFLMNVYRFLRNEAPDILHGYLVVPNLLAILFKPFLRNTKVVWGVRASDMDLSHYDWLARFTFRLGSLLSRYADLIIVNSNCGMAYHQTKGYPLKTMVVVPNGIDTERFKPNAEDRARIRKEWGIGDNEKLIGLVARLDPMKDHLTFLEAAAILAREKKNIRFVCVGDGGDSYREMLQQKSVELKLGGRFLWVGSRTDVPAIYNAFDVATCTSITEGFPNVVGEAMSCGIPCVVTDVGDCARIVGNLGIVIPPRDSRSLADAWNRSLSDAQFVSTMRIRDRIVKEFSLQSLIKNTEHALEQLISEVARC